MTTNESGDSVLAGSMPINNVLALLSDDEREKLKKDYPEFSQDIQQSRELGTILEATTAVSPRTKRQVRMALSAATIAIKKGLKESKPVTEVIEGRLAMAQTLEFCGALISLFGGGGALGNTLVQAYTKTNNTIAIVVGIAAAILAMGGGATSIWAKHLRKTLDGSGTLVEIYRAIVDTRARAELLAISIASWLKSEEGDISAGKDMALKAEEIAHVLCTVRGKVPVQRAGQQTGGRAGGRHPGTARRGGRLRYRFRHCHPIPTTNGDRGRDTGLEQRPRVSGRCREQDTGFA